MGLPNHSPNRSEKLVFVPMTLRETQMGIGNGGTIAVWLVDAFVRIKQMKDVIRAMISAECANTSIRRDFRMGKPTWLALGKIGASRQVLCLRIAGGLQASCY